MIAAVMKHHQEMVASLLAAPPSYPLCPPAPFDFVPSLLLTMRPEAPHASLGVRPDIRAMDDATALFRFRFTIAEMQTLVNKLQLPPTYTTVNRVTVSSLLALAMLLRRLVWPNRLGDLVAEFGYDITSLSLIINLLCTTLASRYSGHLRLWSGITPQCIRTYERAIEAHTPGVRRIWGFIDGTLRQIARPKKRQRPSYSGHKRSHGQHYQAVVTPDGLIVSLLGPFAGSRNDITMWHESLLDGLLRPIVTHGGTVSHLYGDKAYQSLDIIMAPFHPPQSDAEEEYNTLLSNLRIAVEHGFGKITRLWSFTDMKRVHRTGLQPTAAYYFVMTLMTNLHTCMHGNQISEKFDLDPPSVDEYLASA